jgi:hypothetical protein
MLLAGREEIADGLLDLTGLRAMQRQSLGLACGDLGKLSLQGVDDAALDQLSLRSNVP